MTDESRYQVCCGEAPNMAAFAGKPLMPACALCRKSPSWWQRADNRADGKPYQPVQPLGAEGELR